MGEAPITAPSPSIVGDSPCIGDPLWEDDPGDDDSGWVEWSFGGCAPIADAAHAAMPLATPLADTGAVTAVTAVTAAACAWCVTCAVVPATAAALMLASPALPPPATV